MEFEQHVHGQMEEYTPCSIGLYTQEKLREPSVMRRTVIYAAEPDLMSCQTTYVAWDRLVFEFDFWAFRLLQTWSVLDSYLPFTILSLLCSLLSSLCDN